MLERNFVRPSFQLFTQDVERHPLCMYMQWEGGLVLLLKTAALRDVDAFSFCLARSIPPDNENGGDGIC